MEGREAIGSTDIVRKRPVDHMTGPMVGATAGVSFTTSPEL